MLDNEFSDDFGITSEEMENAIEDYGVQEEKEEIKKWYDGYRIGNLDGIYNPWSIFKYLQKGILQQYWTNTSSNDLIKMTLKKSTSVKEKIERLLKDEEIEVKVDQETVITGIEDDEEKNIEETIENAKKQIEEKMYEENLRERGFTNITKMAYAFNGKECKMEYYK